MGNNNNALVVIPEKEILDRIVSGMTEARACDALNIPLMSFIAYISSNFEFAAQIETARAMRAEKWVGNIVSLVTSPDTGAPIIHDKDDVPGVKLAVDTFKWLAKVDSPDRYGDKQSIETHNTNVLEIKGLSPQEALDVLRNDPFAPAVPADYTIVESIPQTEEDKGDEDEDML